MADAFSLWTDGWRGWKNTSLQAAVFSDYFKAKAAKAASGLSDKDSASTKEELKALEERIRVLERIVTENKFDLRQEIDRL